MNGRKDYLKEDTKKRLEQIRMQKKEKQIVLNEQSMEKSLDSPQKELSFHNENIYFETDCNKIIDKFKI